MAGKRAASLHLDLQPFRCRYGENQSISNRGSLEKAKVKAVQHATTMEGISSEWEGEQAHESL